MKKGKLIGFTLGAFVLGIAATMVIMWNSAADVMMIEDQSPYSFEETTSKLEASVKSHNWKIPAVHDLQKSMKKFGHDVEKVTVFELCQPDHAQRILSENNERIVSSLMPCRVAVYTKKDGKTYISRMNTSLMGGMMDGIVPEVMKVASAETEEIIETVLQ